MKKIFSLFAAVLIAGSMMAAPAVSQLAVKKLEAKQHVTLLAKQTTEVMTLDEKVEKSVARKSAHEATDSNNAISLSFDPTQSLINVTTTNNDTYFYILYSTNLYFEYGATDYSTTSMLNVLTSTLRVLDQVNYTQFFVTSGNNVIYPEEDYLWNDGLVADSDYIAIAVPYAAGAINGTPVYTTFTYVAPAAPTSYTNITINNANLNKAYLRSHGILDVYGWNSDSTAYAEFMYYVEDVATAHYTALIPDDVYKGYVALINGTDTTSIDLRYYFDFQVATKDDINYILECHVLGKDGNGYNVSMTFSNAPADTVAVTFEPYYDEQGNGGWNDVTASQGWWQYQGETSDMSLYITLSNYYSISQAAGTYTIDDMYPDYTYIYDYATDKSYSFVSLTVVVTEDDGVVTVTAEGLCENDIYYIITCNTATTPTALENTAAEVKAQKIIENGQVIIIRDGIRYNVLGAQE